MSSKERAAWTRRDLLKLAGGLGLGGALGSAGLATRPVLAGDGDAEEKAAAAGFDYRKAKAIPSICFGCTTHCGVIGWVQDGRVHKIDGNPLDPNTEGSICSKADGMISYTYNPERLLYPLKRVGKRGEGRWKRITWKAALDEIGAKMKALRDAGTPEQFVFHYGRDKTKGFTSRFTNAFGTPNRLNRRSICSSNRRVPLMSMYGRDFEWESQDFANSDFILNFGANPMEAYQGGLFTIRHIIDARVERGAKLITFEVRPSATASVSDEFYTVKPASDGAIALAMARVIIDKGLANKAFFKRWANIPLKKIRERLEPYTPAFAEAESGVPAGDIERLAIAFAKAAPRCTTLSARGSAKHYNGVQADRAIRLLDVLVGNVGKPGGFCLSSLRMWKGYYGQDGLPVIDQPKPTKSKPGEPGPGKPGPWLPGTREFKTLPKEVQKRVAAFPEFWQEKYFGELATPSEYPLAWHWYSMRVGQLVYPYIREGRGKVGVYMSYTLGAAFGFPEAKVAREVLLDEKLIPFHVAIDIAYGEQAALADIILPDATSLERWDAHSTNNYSLVPYTGVRQPMVEPLGEARPVQIMLRDLARRIGGGMEKAFDFEDLEDYYKAWYKELPISWDEFKRRGIWQDASRPKDYELYERPVDPELLKKAEVDEKSGLITVTSKGKKKAIGVMKDGKAVQGFPTPSRLIQVHDPIFSLAADKAGLPRTDINAQDLVSYARVPEHEGLSDEQLVLTTFKWNVHTQGRSAFWKYHSEIVHTNQAFLSPEAGRRFKLKNGDKVEVTVYRPKGETYRANEDKPVGSFINTVRILEGVHPKVIACSHHCGHWEFGPVARAEDARRKAGSEGMDPKRRAADPDIPGKVWWAKSRGGPGNGVAINDALPINPNPLTGGQNWFDNVCKIRKV